MATEDIPSLIAAALKGMSESKQRQVWSLVQRLQQKSDFKLLLSDTFNDCFALGFEEVLLLHHATSTAPFSKDKFEWGMVKVLNDCKRQAKKGPTGLAGYDVEVDGQKWSLKTQADSGIRLDRLHISKFMELGKGKWEDESDLAALRDRMLSHMNGYDRIFSLRCFPISSMGKTTRFYELVEIPKALLAEAKDGVISMNHESKQTPKPGYCKVAGKFELYFDGGTERKLQIKSLMKSHCFVHATWTIADPTSATAS